MRPPSRVRNSSSPRSCLSLWGFPSRFVPDTLDAMKVTDDYDAKLTLWARTPKVVPLPKVSGVPRFGVKRFSSYQELNAWKERLLLEAAEQGGLTWTK